MWGPLNTCTGRLYNGNISSIFYKFLGFLAKAFHGYVPLRTEWYSVNDYGWPMWQYSSMTIEATYGAKNGIRRTVVCKGQLILFTHPDTSILLSSKTLSWVKIYACKLTKKQIERKLIAYFFVQHWINTVHACWVQFALYVRGGVRVALRSHTQHLDKPAPLQFHAMQLNKCKKWKLNSHPTL